MLGNELDDYKKLHWIQKKLRNEEKVVFIKSVAKCGKGLITVNHQRAVALLANKKTAKFAGVTTCKSPWCCPVCTSRKMAQYAEEISVAIDALKDRSMAAAMLTFTIPHTSGFSCEQVTNILHKVWKAFTVHGNKQHGTAKNDIFSNCMQALQSKHRVRVTEYTYGNAGWHPHIHALFWAPVKLLNNFLDWEERLQKRWLELCKRYTIQEILIGYPETQRKTVRAQVITRINIMYSNLNDDSKCVYVSKVKHLGKVEVIKQESSGYICGWGANREVTGNYKEKASNPNHYTWQQILENAINEDNELQPAAGARKKEVRVGRGTGSGWWELFLEYAVTTRKCAKRRVQWSVHSGIKQIIADYKKTAAYKNIVRKNTLKLRETFGVWKTVCWFDVEQWNKVCFYELQTTILELATANDALKKITELFERYRIKPPIINEAAGAKIAAIYNNAA